MAALQTAAYEDDHVGMGPTGAERIAAKVRLRRHDALQAEMIAAIDDPDATVVALPPHQSERLWPTFLHNLKRSAAHNQTWSESERDVALSAATAACRALPASRLIWLMPTACDAAGLEVSSEQAAQLLVGTDRQRDTMVSTVDGAHGLCLELNAYGRTNEFELTVWP